MCTSGKVFERGLTKRIKIKYVYVLDQLVQTEPYMESRVMDLGHTSAVAKIDFERNYSHCLSAIRQQ